NAAIACIVPTWLWPGKPLCTVTGWRADLTQITLSLESVLRRGLICENGKSRGRFSLPPGPGHRMLLRAVRPCAVAIHSEEIFQDADVTFFACIGSGRAVACRDASGSPAFPRYHCRRSEQYQRRIPSE